MKTLNKSIRQVLRNTALVATLGMSTMTLAGQNYEGEMKDAWVDGKVESALLINRHLNNFTIDTEVHNGTLMLSGTVQTEADKGLAEQVAQNIEGVDKVINKLKVDRDVETTNRKFNSESEEDQRSWNQWFDDATTTAAVKSKFLWNSDVDGLDINVDTMNGVVTLKGEADNVANMKTAISLASSTEGVRRVSNQLTVEGKADNAMSNSNDSYELDNKLKDAWIDGKIESALLVNTHLNNFTIDTEVKDGEVFLSGTVKSDVDKNLAGEIAKSIKGVTDVENNLVVEKDLEVTKRETNSEAERSWNTWYSDATTTASIKSKFLWNDHVDGLDINVDTIYGVVTLSGEADTNTNKDLAEQIAQNTDGVEDVINKLIIQE